MCRCRCATSTNRLPCPSKTFSPSLDAARGHRKNRTRKVKTSEEVEIVAFARRRRKWSRRGDVQELLDEGIAGDNVGLLLRGTEKDDVERGQVVCKPGSITPHTKFKAEAYVLTKEEGGRHTPFFSGYRPQFYFRTTDVTGDMKLPQGVEMSCRATREL